LHNDYNIFNTSTTTIQKFSKECLKSILNGKAATCEAKETRHLIYTYVWLGTTTIGVILIMVLRQNTTYIISVEPPISLVPTIPSLWPSLQSRGKGVNYPTGPQPKLLVLPWTAANDRSVAAHSNQKVQRKKQAGCSSVETSQNTKHPRWHQHNSCRSSDLQSVNFMGPNLYNFIH